MWWMRPFWRRLSTHPSAHGWWRRSIHPASTCVRPTHPKVRRSLSLPLLVKLIPLSLSLSRRQTDSSFSLSLSLSLFPIHRVDISPHPNRLSLPRPPRPRTHLLFHTDAKASEEREEEEEGEEEGKEGCKEGREEKIPTVWRGVRGASFV